MASIDDQEEGTSGYESDSESDNDAEEVMAKLTKEELIKVLSEVLKSYNNIKLKYKKLKSSLKSEIDLLKTELVEQKEINLKIKNDFEITQQESESEAKSCENILEKYDSSFQRFLTKSIDRSKMASMIYGVSGNNRRCIGYESSPGSNPKSFDKLFIKKTPMYSQFKFGHLNDIKHTSSEKNTYVFKPKASQNKHYVEKQKFRQTYKPTNPKGPKKIWVPKNKIIPVADVLSSKVRTPIMVPGLWMLTTHDRRKVYVPKPGT